VVVVVVVAVMSISSLISAAVISTAVAAWLGSYDPSYC